MLLHAEHHTWFSEMKQAVYSLFIGNVASSFYKQS